MHLEANPDEVDTVDDLRTRLTGDDRLWEAVTTRLAAFARLERLAEAQGMTPEALAVRAAVAREEARLEELQRAVAATQQELAALDAVRTERVAGGLDLTLDDDEVDRAFAAFFDSELEYDKSRAWILSDEDLGA